MNSAKILIVEDDQFLRELYSDILTNEGYRVEEAKDGEEGLKKMKEGGYDIVLLDILVAKISGIEIMKNIKAYPPQNPNKFTIFFTNLDDPKEIKEALKLADGYIIKSQITPDKLINKVKSILKQLSSRPIRRSRSVEGSWEIPRRSLPRAESRGSE